MKTPTELEVQHVLDNVGNEVSSTDGWLLCNKQAHFKLVSDLECLKDDMAILLKQRRELREALMAIKVEHLNKRISLTLPIHGQMENALENTKELP